MLKRSRIIIMSTIVFVIIIGFTFQLMQDQVVNGPSYRNQASNSTLGSMTIVAPRGEILDRYGRVLATNTIGYSIVIESAFFPSSKQLKQQNVELLELCNLIGQDGGQWEDSLPISTTTPFKYNASSTKNVKAMIKFINENKSKNQVSLAANASATAVMNQLDTIYKTQGYTDSQQRTLCGIRYEMAVNDFTYTSIYTFAQNVSFDAVTKIEERSSSLPGVVVQQNPVRSYPSGTIAPNIIGLTGPIQADQLSEYTTSKGYSADDIVGQFGIEESMEKYLHGTNGTQQVEMNSNGDVASTQVVTKPKPGDNVVLTIDEDLQVDVQNMLPVVVNEIKAASNGDPKLGADAQGAAAVVMNIKTGEVYAMATYPSFNLNTYKQDISTLSQDKLTPLIDRADYGTYRPGSTFKPITATSGIMNGIITPDTKWNVPSQFLTYASLGAGRSYIGSDDNGESHYGLDVQDALEISSNVFFNMLGNDLQMKRLEDTATKVFGIGKKTGIELPDEKSGVMSGYAYADKEGLTVNPADAAQAAIGQLYTKLTPLQMVNYMSILMRGGTQYQVHIVKQVNSYDNSKVILDNSAPKTIANNEIPEGAIEAVKEGMLKVTQGDNGTATDVFKGFNMKVGGKTGTAQIGSLSSPNLRFDGLFICFAPYDDPQIAISVVVEDGHNGYQTAPVAREAIQNYFNLNSSGNSIVNTVTSTKTGTLLQ